MPKRIPEPLSFLESAPTWTLYSLDPDGRDDVSPEKAFRGYRILGKMEFDKSKSEPLMAALKKGIQESNGRVFNCFNPRLGISATHDGHSIELVICFECARIKSFYDGHITGFSVAHSPEKYFDAVFKEAHVLLAAKSE